MAYDGDLLRISGVSVVGLKTYKITRAKLWADAERNMAGSVRATMIGIFPKLELGFRAGLTEEQVSSICRLLDQAYFSVAYFDPKTKSTTTASYYAGDYSVELMDKARGLYKEFSVNLVPVDKV